MARSSSSLVYFFVSDTALRNSWISPPRCAPMICSAICASNSRFGLSEIGKITSNLVNNAGGISICSDSGAKSWNRPNLGFAAAKIAHLEDSAAVIPAFATCITCCSIASCMAERSWGDILSISSTHASPPSASTSAPASSTHRPSPNSSRTAAAVKPAAVVALPDA